MGVSAKRVIAILAVPIAMSLLSCSKTDTTSTGTTSAGNASTTANAGATYPGGGAAYGSTTKPGGATGSTAAGGATGSTATGGSATGSAEVVAKSFKFTPDKITAGAGGTVTFKNDDSVPHEPTAGTPDAPKESLFDLPVEPGSTVTTPALPKGETPYFCALHKSMLGTITVS